MNCVKGLKKCFGKEPSSRVLILGLDGAGKTTIVYYLKYRKIVKTLPTVGFNIEELQIDRKLKIKLWDVGGHYKVRHLWTHYYVRTSGLIYVIDGCAIDRIKEAKEYLFNILSHPYIEEGIPIMILVNKQDLENSSNPSEIIEYLELNQLTSHPWIVQGCSIFSNNSISEGMEKFASMMGGIIRFPKSYGTNKYL